MRARRPRRKLTGSAEKHGVCNDKSSDAGVENFSQTINLFGYIIEGRIKVQNKLLTPEQQYMIDQVAATLAIEEMSLTQQGYNNIKLILTGEKTADEAVADTIRRYFHG